jgi:hypothetical protein
MPNKPAVIIKRDAVDPEPVEVIVQSIKDIAAGMRAVNSTRLTQSAIVVLIHDRSKVSKSNIRVVLNNLADLERVWLK